jgi:hypothetical protein
MKPSRGHIPPSDTLAARLRVSDKPTTTAGRERHKALSKIEASSSSHQVRCDKIETTPKIPAIS